MTEEQDAENAARMISSLPFCAECGATLAETALYRDNPKGEAALWKCLRHMTRPVDSSDEVVRIVKALEAK